MSMLSSGKCTPCRGDSPRATEAEIEELNHLAKEVAETPWNLAEFKSVQV